MQENNDTKVSETEDNENQAASKVVIQQKQVTIDKLLACTVKLEERVMALKGGLVSASHFTSIFRD